MLKMIEEKLILRNMELRAVCSPKEEIPYDRESLKISCLNRATCKTPASGNFFLTAVDFS